MATCLESYEMRSCLFCGTTAGPATDEHVIPKWARDAFDIQGWLTVSSSDSPGSGRKQVGRLQHLNIVFKGGICQRCNNDWLGSIERKVQPLLEPMALARPTVLEASEQALLALWAVKTCLLLELAIRQKYPGRRAVEGYMGSSPELAWLWKKNAPPPRSMVWLGCWDCQRTVPMNYEPSSAELPTVDGSPLTGHLTTFTLGFVAFQVFTVDFVAAELRGAPVWNTRPPESLDDALPRIWPPLMVVPDVSWPPSAFANGDWRRLVTWEGRLRSHGDNGQPA